MEPKPTELQELQAKLDHAERCCADQLSKLRAINVRRCEAVFHKLTDWTPAEWACAMAGEAGEVCNVAKKVKRLETGTNTAKDPQTLDECRRMMADELADTIIYADLLAARMGIDLWEAIVRKFNVVSDRMKTNIKLSSDCGKDYVPKNEADKLREALRKISDISQLTNVTFEVQAFTAADIAQTALKEGK